MQGLPQPSSEPAPNPPEKGLVAHETTPSQQPSSPSISPQFFWWFVIPWLIALIAPGVTYMLGRRSKGIETAVGLVIADITSFAGKISELSKLIRVHQNAVPIEGADSLKASREKLTDLRRAASEVHGRVHDAIVGDEQKRVWRSDYLEWKEMSDGETNLITNKLNKWSSAALSDFANHSDAYLKRIAKFQRRVAANKIPID